ncbi:hypothetical protein JCM10449v2_000316 [Rhodotorula kratochvilovae]
MADGPPPWRTPAPVSPTSTTSLPPPAPPARDAARAKLAAALLGHDLSLEPLDPSLSVRSSAVLQPFQHLLAADPPEATRATAPSPTSSFELVDAPEEAWRVPPGAYSAGSDGGRPFERRASLAGSAVWSANGLERATTPLELDPEEEERLVSEWGIDEVMSSVSDGGDLARRASTGLMSGTMTGVGLARFAGASAMSDAGVLTREDAPSEDDEAVEVLETRSMPDLDRPRAISFADSVLDGLEQRLANAPASKAPLASTSSDVDDDRSDGPRIKIIERTPTQRRQRRQRLRTQSVGTAAGLSSLPSLADLSGDGSVGGLDSASSGTRAGIASRDSLFMGPAPPGISRRGSTMSAGLSEGLSNRRASTDAGLTSRPVSRLSLAIPAATASSDRPASPASPVDPSAPRPSTSLSVSPTTPGFTSRFDPLVIAAQRAELTKDRPAFANSDAGKPPRVVLMPAPLAGRPPSPPRLERVEGPGAEGSDGSDEEEELAEEGEEEEDAPGLREPLRPAGALYGRSLMDVMAERRALLKAQQRAYVPGSDGRRSMFEWKAPASGAEDALAHLEGHAARADVDDREDDVPLALVPAGGRGRRPRGDSPEKARKAHASIFGPDLVYQRELARVKEIEEIERAEREAEEERRRAKEDRRKSKGKLVKGAKRRSQLVLAEAQPQEWQPPSEPELELEREWETQPEQEYVEELVEPEQPRSPPRRRNSLAPSLSIPLGLGDGLASSASGSDWFAPTHEPKHSTAAPDSDEDDDDDFKPRPISSLGGYLSAGAARRRTTFESSGSSSGESDNEETAAIRPVNGNASRASLPLPGVASIDDHDAGDPAAATAGGHLPFPGEPSSQGHDSRSLAETEEDDRPLGARYSRQSLALVPSAMDSDDEDERPLGQRFSRASFMPASAQPPMLQLDLGLGGGGVERLADGKDEASEDEDDKPLGARFSTIRAVDEDDVPLAIRRLSLAPPRFEPAGTLHALDDDGRTVSDDSDDRPLGLKALPPAAAPFPAFPFNPSQPALMPGFPPVAPALPYSYSQYSLPLAAAPVPLPMYGAAPPDPRAQLALAQMQMQAAMQQQVVGDPAAAAAAGPGMIERWRREVSG